MFTNIVYPNGKIESVMNATTRDIGIRNITGVAEYCKKHGFNTFQIVTGQCGCDGILVSVYNSDGSLIESYMDYEDDCVSDLI